MLGSGTVFIASHFETLVKVLNFSCLQPLTDQIRTSDMKTLVVHILVSLLSSFFNNFTMTIYTFRVGNTH